MIAGPLRMIVPGTMLVFTLACSSSTGTHTHSPIPSSNTPNLTVLAGVPTGAGYMNGIGENGRFACIHHLAMDHSGNIYTPDSYNHTIRKITPEGNVTTIAGQAGQSGSTDGMGSDARFEYPNGIAVDSFGNVFVADQDASTIRKITPEGMVTTLAGKADLYGNSDGNGADARFHRPSAVTVDNAGILYIADSWNNAVRKITQDGVVTTLVISSSIFVPTGIAVDASKNLYVVTSDSAIVKITSEGITTNLAGGNGIGSADGLGAMALFFEPNGVAVNRTGHLYVADTGNSTIRVVAPDGQVTTLAGMARESGNLEGKGSAARFSNPNGIAIDPSGNAWVADSNNFTIRKITPDGSVSTFVGKGQQWGSTDGQSDTARFRDPRSVVQDQQGNTYVADGYNSTIRKITPDGIVTTLAGWAGRSGHVDGRGTDARFWTPDGLAVDAKGNLYVVDAWDELFTRWPTSHYKIRKITPEGDVTTLPVADGNLPWYSYWDSKGIAVDTTGNVYVSQGYGIRQITPDGQDLTWADTYFSSLVGGLAVDAKGTLYVADTEDNVIYKVTPGKAPTILAGTPGQMGSIDGAGTAARFNSPKGISLDNSENLFVADTENHTIRKITPSGVVSTVVGVPTLGQIVLGELPAQLFRPTGVAVDASGNLLIAAPNAVLKADFKSE